MWSTKLQKIDLVTSHLFLKRRGGGGSSPRRWGPAPNQLIGIDSTFHTYARLMGQISAEQRGREAAKQLYVTGRLQTAMVRSRRPGCPGRNWFDFVTKCRAKLCFKTENEDLCYFLFFPPKSVKVSASWPLAKKESGPVCLPERCERTHEAGQIRPFTCYTCSRNNGSNNRPHSFIFLSTWPFILAGSSLEIRIFFLAFTTQIAEIMLLETSHTEHWDWK